MRLSLFINLISLTLITGCGRSAPPVQFGPGDVKTPPGQVASWDFDADVLDELPAGVTVFSGVWMVQSDMNLPSSPNVLCQTGKDTYPALILGDSIYGNLEVTARFNPIRGIQDQAAGIVFRIQDKDNYYIVRANALENNVNIYKYVNGVRSVLKNGRAKVKFGEWQTLGVAVMGNQIRGFINDQLVVEATDDTFDAGFAGLWTKADSYTCFDNIQITSR